MAAVLVAYALYPPHLILCSNGIIDVGYPGCASGESSCIVVYLVFQVIVSLPHYGRHKVAFAETYFG